MVPNEDELQTVDNSLIAERHSLYVRFPKKLDSDRTLAEAEVRCLHSKIIRVRIPRQRSANYCMIDFDTKDDKEKALKKIKKIQVNDKNLVVKEAVRNDKNKVNKKIEKVQTKRKVNHALSQLVGEIKKNLVKDYRKRNITNGVIVRALKTGTTQADVRQSFPRAIDVKMHMKAELKNSFALIWMQTPKDAKEIAKGVVQINGEDYAVSLQKDKKKQKSGKTTNDNQSENDGKSEESGSENLDSEDEVVGESD